MSDNGKGLHVAALEIQDFLSIREAQIAPGKVTRIEGKNGQGKTACLKAVVAAFKGAGAEVINLEADRAQVLVRLSDDTTIQRSFIRGSKRQPPRITTGDGMRPASPQTYLDRLLGPTVFNPVQFLLLPANERRRYLLQAVPASISASKIAEATGDLVEDTSGHALDVLDRLRVAAYSARTEVNHRLKQARAHHRSIAPRVGPEPDGMEEHLAAVEGEMAERGPALARAEAALEYEAENDERRQRLQAKVDEIERDLGDAVAYGEDELSAQDAKVNDLRRQLEEAEARLESMWDVNRAVTEKIDELAEVKRELGEIPEPKVTAAQVEEMRRYNAQLERRIETARKWARWRTAKNAADQAEAEVMAAEQAVADLDHKVKAYAEDLPRQVMADLEFPVPGLALSEDRITVDGKDLDQLSTSEQMKVSLALAKSLAGDLKVILVDRAESLDAESFAALVVEAESETDGFQYLVTRVTDQPSPGAFHVEDGRVSLVGEVG